MTKEAIAVAVSRGWMLGVVHMRILPHRYNASPLERRIHGMRARSNEGLVVNLQRAYQGKE